MLEARTKAVEKQIQRLLIDFEEEVGSRIDHVRVDTRNYANCSVEIFFAQPTTREDTAHAR